MFVTRFYSDSPPKNLFCTWEVLRNMNAIFKIMWKNYLGYL